MGGCALRHSCDGFLQGRRVCPLFESSKHHLHPWNPSPSCSIAQLAPAAPETMNWTRIVSSSISLSLRTGCASTTANLRPVHSAIGNSLPNATQHRSLARKASSKVLQTFIRSYASGVFVKPSRKPGFKVVRHDTINSFLNSASSSNCWREIIDLLTFPFDLVFHRWIALT
jgi:hypothetical protein